MFICRGLVSWPFFFLITGGKTPDPQARTYQQILQEKALAQQEVHNELCLYGLIVVFNNRLPFINHQQLNNIDTAHVVVVLPVLSCSCWQLFAETRRGFLFTGSPCEMFWHASNLPYFNTYMLFLFPLLSFYAKTCEKCLVC